MDQDALRGFDYDLYISRIWNPVSDPGVFDAAGDSSIFGLLEHAFDRFQGFADAYSGMEYLSCRGHASRGEGIVVANLPAIEPSHLTEFINTAFNCEIDLVYPESSHSTAGNVVGIYCSTAYLDRIDMVGPSCMSGCPFQYLHAHRCIGSRIANDVAFHESETTHAVTAHLDIHRQRMPFWMHADRFLTSEGDTNRFFQEEGRQGGMTLNRKILFSSKASTIGHQLHAYLFLRKSKDTADAFAVFVNALALRIHLDPLFPRGCKTTFHFHERMFDTLGRVGPTGDEGTFLSGILQITSMDFCI